MQFLDVLIPAFNAEHCLERTLEAIFGQSIPAGLDLGVIVVNNRSTDSTGELIERWASKGVRRIDHHDAQGRSSTINAGVAASKADYVLVLDADCRLAGDDCLSLVAGAMAQNIDAGFGYATGASDDFWGRYHRQLEADRVVAGWQGWTTQCCLIKQESFEAVNGFPTEYQHYGFEDRDFICRLRSFNGIRKLVSLPNLRALHDDDTTAQDVFRKTYVSGRYSSGIFKRNFPQEYLATVYAAVDVDTASAGMALMLRLLQPFRSILARTTAGLTKRSSTPIFIGRPAVKLCSALSYFRGTIDRNREL